jgi:ribose transport system ATP-binding protein
MICLPRETTLPTPLIELRDVSKAFGGARALIDVDLCIEPGEVHGLLGQNGSGKSTLLKVLSGFHEPDAGALRVRGVPVELPLAPGAFRALGFAFVHQDLALVPGLSVTENLIVSRLAGRGRTRVNWRRENAAALRLLERYGLEGIDPKAPVATLTQMQRALVAVVRAVEELRADGHGSGLLVLDEPTAFLPRVGIERLFALVRETVRGGGSVLFVTHDLDEVREVCDRVTVLRDGRRAGSVEVAATGVDELVEMIIGHRLERRAAEARPLAGGEVALRASAIAGGILRGVDLEARRGEVLGVTGLLGSGFEELVHVLFGARDGSGTLELDGATLDVAALSPRRAISLGIGFVPADRPLEAAIGSLSVADNVTMTTLPAHRGRFGLSRASLRTTAAEIGERHGVTPNRPELPLQSLSGGNQQKAVLGKWLRIDPPVLLLDQPTQGVDVGAREQIFAAVRAAAGRGTAVVCASADYEELAGLCDRVLVLARGTVVRELSGEELTKERIAEQVLTSTSTGDALATN